MNSDERVANTIAASGREGFVSRHNLWSETQQNAATEVVAHLESDDIHILRLSFADQHGVLRGKGLLGPAMSSALRNGCTVTSTLLLKDTSHRTVFPVWQADGGLGNEAFAGAADVLMVPDPLTFKYLPWRKHTAWMQCDLYFADGTPVPFDSRALARRALGRLHDRGYRYVSGLELECHVYRCDNPRLAPQDATMPAQAPELSLLGHGYQYLTEARLDELEPVLEPLRATLLALGLPLRSMEVEFGPSQMELTLGAADGIATADYAMLMRSAVKQSLAQHGLLATFMCRPALPNTLSSGWHLHQSLWRDGFNAFVSSTNERMLSTAGGQVVAGLLKHARAACAFTTPTINGYKRYQPNSLAPDRASWGRDNRGSMLRVVGDSSDGNTHIENRVGEPAANPYLYLASQLVCTELGLQHEYALPPISKTPYSTKAPALPVSLMESLDALAQDETFATAFGREFVDYFSTIKRAEIQRFLSTVTDWEQREYIRLF